ncbi:MAG TPA: molybdopterin cofactor-binding domain-containing protein, partial [Stellaceae bacterium]|nr:molybdopterin cofactor-binding domain-containing protein [Stellaceae bacterium]
LPHPAFLNIYGGKDLLTGGHPEAHPGLFGSIKDWAVTEIASVATEQYTGGSTAIRDGYFSARQAGAAARALLIAAAARTWQVPPAECATREGVVVHEGSHRHMSYGALAQLAAGLNPPADVALKPRAQWRLIGTRAQRVDLPRKVDGSAVFGIDVRRPGMLFATVLHSPILGGKLKAIEAGAATRMPGVKAVKPLPTGVAVVAETTWQAMQGAAALTLDWEAGPAGLAESRAIEKQFRGALDGKLASAYSRGDVALALKSAAKTLRADYQLPYLAHATMEPMNCTAEITPSGVELWVPTQVQSRAVKVAAAAAGMKEAQVRLHTTYLGGGFGRRSEIDLIEEAVILAKAMARPIQVVWSREEDMRNDFYRPAMAARIEAGLDPTGMPIAWRHRIAVQSIFARVFPPATWLGADPTMVEGAVDLPYAIAHQAVDYAVQDTIVPVGPWRSVGHSLNAFVKESFLDELAAAALIDPLELRRRLLTQSPRARAVLDLAASKGNWGAAMAAGEGRGIALHASFGSLVAEVAEVAVSDGEIKVKRVVAAVDCGTVINPSLVEAQIESAIVYGLTAALYGKITLEKGRVVEGNFPDYPMLRLAQMPVIEVHLIASDADPGGVGEPATPPIAPAVANAVFAATGKRVRALPLMGRGFKV